MTTSKSTIKWAALAILGLTTFVSSTRVEAKPAKGAAKGAMHGKGFAAKKLAVKLNLSETQKTRIQSIMQSARTDSQAVKNNAALSPEQKKAQLKTIHSNARSATDEVLTPAQREQLSQMRAQHKENRGERREKIDLSDAQKAQIKTIRQRAQSDTQAVRSNTSLSREDKRAQLKTIRANTQSAISSLLTPAQRAQKEAMKAENKDKRQEKRGERKGSRQNASNGLNN